MIVFAGGVSLANSAYTDLYNNTLAKWTPGPPLSIARRALTGVAWGSKLYFIGGFALAESGGTLRTICLSFFTRLAAFPFFFILANFFFAILLHPSFNLLCIVFQELVFSQN